MRSQFPEIMLKVNKHMFESYSKQSIAAASNSLRILDDNLNYDFEEDKPEGIPSNKDFEATGIGDMFFNSEKKKKAKLRQDFNSGVIYEVCLFHYDGKPRGFESFCLKAIKNLASMGSVIASAFKKSFNNQTPEFNTGRKWGKTFVKRRISLED